MSAIAPALRKHGVCVRDLIEIENPATSLEGDLCEILGEQPGESDGWLVEITAIGELAILGCHLEGHDQRGSETCYDAFTWRRASDERRWSEAKVLRKVGFLDRQGKCCWTLPKAENVYSRCQGPPPDAEQENEA